MNTDNQCGKILPILQEIVSQVEESDKKVKSKLKRKHKHNRRVKNRQYIWDYLKTHPCVICGESDPVVLEFNHIDPSTKIDTIAQLMKHTFTPLLNEIEKCEVMCSNCHARHTAIQQNWYKDIVK